MVALETLQTLLTFVTLISVPVGVFYHIMTLRNTRRNQQLQLETRQAQLLMNLYETYSSPDFRSQLNTIWYLEWSDYDDFWEKYGGENNPEIWSAWQSIAGFWNGIGILVKRGLADIGMIDELLGNILVGIWPMMEPIIIGYREQVEGSIQERRAEGINTVRTHKVYEGFEYLFNEHQRYVREHPELQID